MLRHACGYSLANRGTDTRLIRTTWDIGQCSTQHFTQKSVPAGLPGCFRSPSGA
jgi:hypothetical protein